MDCAFVDEPVWERRDSLCRLNPAGEVPVMTDENGIVLCGSYAISEYLEEGYEDSGFLGKTLAERAEVRRLITWFDVKFYHEVSQPVLFEKFYRRLLQYGVPDSETLRHAALNIKYHLEYIAELTENHRWLAGEYISLADFAAAAHISALDYLGNVPWEQAPERTRNWYAIMKSRPAFRPLLADRMPGFTPPAHYDNPDF